jgi:predicted ABC-type ATPase
VPLLTVIAGPNGAGKSTAIAQLHPPGVVVNVDEIARDLRPSDEQNIRAARIALGSMEKLLASRADFNFETTLSSHQAIEVMRKARAIGYRLELAYIILRSPALHVARVQQRVAQGGHDIPVDVIQRRYACSLANLPKAVRLADQTIIYDNTEPELKTLIRRTRTKVLLDALHDWRALDETLAQPIAAAM